MQSSDSDNCWTQCQCGRDSPPSSTCQASCLQQTLQPNPCGFSDLENHNCLATDITGTAFDFALGNYSQPDLLASLTESYHPPPPDSLPDLFKNGALDAASDLDIFNDLSHDQSSDAWLALNGAGSAIDGSLDSSPETIFTMMYKESFLAATLNPLAPDPTLFPASAEPSSNSSSARPSPHSTVESTFSNDPNGPSSSASSSSSSAGSKRKRPADESPPVDGTLADKRRRNNLAAAKYRQKKVDRITELEKEVEDVSKERDELKLQLARRDAELDVLRRLLVDRK